MIIHHLLCIFLFVVIAINFSQTVYNTTEQPVLILNKPSSCSVTIRVSYKEITVTSELLTF